MSTMLSNPDQTEATPVMVSKKVARRSFAGRWAVLAVMWSSVTVLVVGWALTMVDPHSGDAPVLVRCVGSVFAALIGLVVALPVVALAGIVAGAFRWATWNDRFGRR